MEVFDLHTLLRHGVAVANRYAVVIQGVMVHSDTERCTYRVLTTITLTNRACFVVSAREFLAKFTVKFSCFRAKFFLL